ncbi:DMT family transporter [Aminobacter aminovorans]|uniref:DMT family transporter n=1 Tax=Aminobacter aminovorans TaxID=83263 RepID=UPI0028571C55|nr:DMT family transporter [Aminobacter aminovorans]MDR7222728.1 drug/metabolite transporter (DMT)-like permease [Aminobacter aminovorans]
MSGFALTIVLVAAFLHASWNAVVKAATDRAVVLAAVSATHAILGFVLVFFATPPSQASWIYIFLSTVIHYGYYVFLFQSYRLGDLSQVYPIARGLAPALVAFGAYVMIGETLPPLGWVGLGAITFGIAFLAFQRGAAHADPRAVGAAAINGVLIASYSVIDGIGVRLSDSPFGYMGWLFLLEFPVTLFVLFRRRGATHTIDRKTVMLGLVGGLGAVSAYGLVIYAKTIAPLGAVSAVRESSVIIAALIGLFIFGERPWQARILSAAIVAGGVIALAFSG